MGSESQVQENEEGEGQNADDVAMEEEDVDEENPDAIDEEQSRYLKWPTNTYHNERFYGYVYHAGHSAIRTPADLSFQAACVLLTVRCRSAIQI